MTIAAPPRASRIPIAEPTGEARLCFRCGIEWADHRLRYIRRAPCRDCRDTLTREGEDIIGLYIRPEKQAAAYAAAERRQQSARDAAERERARGRERARERRAAAAA